MTEKETPEPLEDFLREMGATTAELQLLRDEHVARKMLAELRQSNTYAITILNAKALEIFGSSTLEEIFTKELTTQLSVNAPVRTRFLGAMKSYVPSTEPPGASSTPIRTIAELHGLGLRELKRLPNFSAVTIKYVTAVLDSIGIRLIDS